MKFLICVNETRVISTDALSAINGQRTSKVGPHTALCKFNHLIRINEGCLESKFTIKTIKNQFHRKKIDSSSKTDINYLAGK